MFILSLKSDIDSGKIKKKGVFCMENILKLLEFFIEDYETLQVIDVIRTIKDYIVNLFSSLM